MHAKLNPVVSSNIEGYLYLTDRRVLLIAFKSGGTYAYEDVPSWVDIGFRDAPSKGKFFQSDIKDKYVVSKLDDMAVANLLGGTGAAQPTPRRKTATMTLQSLMQRYPMLNAIF
jgi:lysyl-tRNA synthetase class 2